MVGALIVVLVNELRKYNNWIANKQVGNMFGKQFVNSCSAHLIKLQMLPQAGERTVLAHAMIKGLVYRKRTIVVLGTIHPAL
jgi:hypothetical protein